MNQNLNWANFVTLIRLIIGVFAVVNYIYSGLTWINGILFLLFVILDGLDGFLARKLKCETPFGKNFDIFTDGLISFSLAGYLFLIGVIPILYVVLIAGPVLMMLIGIGIGFQIKGNTFINGEWKNLNGFALFLTLVLFLINHKYSLVGAYVILVFFYISYAKFLFDMVKLKKAHS